MGDLELKARPEEELGFKTPSRREEASGENGVFGFSASNNSSWTYIFDKVTPTCENILILSELSLFCNLIREHERDHLLASKRHFPVTYVFK